MKDAQQKDLLYRHFRAQGWFALLEVPVKHRAGLDGKPKLVTDVDVLGLRASPSLRWRRILGDCKTKKSESPVNRVLWIRGLMEQFGADEGIVVLSRPQGIEPDHKLLAADQGVTLLNERDFDAYDKAMLFPSGSGSFNEGTNDLLAVREAGNRFRGLQPILSFTAEQAWNRDEYTSLLRSSIARLTEARGEVDPQRNEHMAVVLEAAAVFSVGLAEAIGKVFHRHLAPNEPSILNAALLPLIWGSADTYASVTRFRERLLAARGIDASEPLTLPNWPAFIELVRRMLEAPKKAFNVPQALRATSIAFHRGQEHLGERPYDPMTLHLSAAVARYFFSAGGLPNDAVERIDRFFMKVTTPITFPKSLQPTRGSSKSELSATQLAYLRRLDVDDSGLQDFGVRLGQQLAATESSSKEGIPMIEAALVKVLKDLGVT